MKKILSQLFSVVLLFILGCANPLSAGANKDTDEALYEDVEKLMDTSDWDGALTKLQSLSSSFKARPDVIRTWAGVYAGKCGLDFISFTTALESANISSTTLFKYLMNAFQTRSVTPASCDLAQSKMEEIGVYPWQRQAPDNFFMAVLGMVKMGTYLRNYADTDQDGATDAGFNSCSTASISDANMNNFITGFGLVTANASFLPSAVSGSIGSYFTTIGTLCGASCQITDPTKVQSTDRDIFRDILKTGPANPTLAVGIETCNTVGVVTCCP